MLRAEPTYRTGEPSMAHENESNIMSTLPETITETTAETTEPSDLLSRLSLIVGLSAIVLACANIVATIALRAADVSLPGWAFQAQRLVPQVGIILAAAGVGLSLIGTWHLLARHRLFDPKETQQDLAIDDLSALLTRIHPGCALRVASPLGLVAMSLALLLSVWLVPIGGHFLVTANNSAHTCSMTRSLAPFSIELDNSASTTSVSWSATPVETVAEGTGWAHIIPAHGKLAAGQDQRISVVANPLVCNPATAAERHSAGALAVRALAPSLATYHVRVTTSGTSTSYNILAMSVLGQVASTGSPAPTTTALPTASPTPKRAPTAISVAPTATPVRISPTATPTPCPALTASITAPPNGQVFTTNSFSPFPVSFTGSITGACGVIPTSDMTWSETSPTPTIMGNGESVTYSFLGSSSGSVYDITFQVHDPTSGQTATSSIQITIVVQLP
jgi:hypothetical protein